MKHSAELPRPEFAKQFPDTPEINRLLQAFELGNYRLVQKEGKRLIESAKDDNVKRSASELIARTQPDRLSVFLVVISVMLLVILASLYWSKH